MARQKVKLSKEASKVQFFIGILFSIFGISMIIGTILTPLPLPPVLFGIIWTVIAVFNTYQAYKNGFTEDGMAYYEIESSIGTQGNEPDFEERLRKVEGLHKDGIITDKEYLEKRESIMKEKW